MVLKLYVLLGHRTKLTHTKFCDKINHILRVRKKMTVPDIKNMGLVSGSNPLGGFFHNLFHFIFTKFANIAGCSISLALGVLW